MKKLLLLLLLIVISLVSCLSFDDIDIDPDLSFLKDLSNDELMPIVAVMKDRISDELSYEAKTDPKNNLAEIIRELELYGGYTHVNVGRGIFNWLFSGKFERKGVPYREILEDVCKKKRIQFDRNLSTEDLGKLLVEQTLEKTIDKMDPNQRKDLIDAMAQGMEENEFNYVLKQVGGRDDLLYSSGRTIANLLVSVASGEEFSAVSLICGISENFEVPIPLSVNLLANGYLNFLGGWEYIVITVIAAAEIGAPAYRVTMPAVTYIECMRIIQREKAWNLSSMTLIITIVFILLSLFCIYFFIANKKIKNNGDKKETCKTVWRHILGESCKVKKNGDKKETIGANNNVENPETKKIEDINKNDLEIKEKISKVEKKEIEKKKETVKISYFDIVVDSIVKIALILVSLFLLLSTIVTDAELRIVPFILFLIFISLLCLWIFIQRKKRESLINKSKVKKNGDKKETIEANNNVENPETKKIEDINKQDLETKEKISETEKREIGDKKETIETNKDVENTKIKKIEDINKE